MLAAVPLQPFVFISYAREDRDAVAELCGTLERGGYGRWLDEEQVAVGERLDAELDAAIERASLFIACLTPRYTQKSVDKDGYIRRELQRAVARTEHLAQSCAGLPFLLPVVLEKCEVPALLPASVVRGEIGSIQGVEQLLSSVHRVLQRRGLIGMTVIAEQGPDRGRVWHLSGPLVHIGRAANGHVVLSDPKASAAHARIEVRKRATFFHHASSSATSELRGTRSIRFDPNSPGSARLLDGDRIHLGDTVLSVELTAVDFHRLAITTTTHQ